MSARLVAAAALLAALPAAASSLAAQEFRYLAFGDSITFGSFDEANKGGYPGRLGPALGCSPGVCKVENQGLGGERTGAGVTRIGTLLAAKRYDIALIMEGTNDIFRNPPISNNTIQFNLETMAGKATAAGVDSLLASIIWFHPDGTRGNSRDPQVEDLKDRLEQVAAAEGYYFANPWAVLCPNRPCFDQHYFPGVPSPDPVGHPDASGYDIMTGVFQDRIESQPVPAIPAPFAPTGQQTTSPAAYTWSRETPQGATWYQLTVLDGTGGEVFSGWYRAQEVCSGAFCTAQLQLNLTPGNYSWQVRGRNPKGRSPFSSGLVFSVLQGQTPTIALQSGSCSGGGVVIDGTFFPPNTEVGLVMAAGNSGFVKSGIVCPGASFAISEPFVLPPTWVATDGSGAFSVELSGQECLVQALAVSTCQVSNLLTLPQ